MSTIRLKNLRNTLLDLSGVTDVHGKRVLLAPAGKAGDTAECDAKAEQHDSVKAMKDAKWLEVAAPDLKPAPKAKPADAVLPPDAPPAPPAENAPPAQPVLADAQAPVDAAAAPDAAAENVAGVDTVKVESGSDDTPAEGGKKKKRW
jgi:hypothetical protein